MAGSLCQGNHGAWENGTPGRDDAELIAAQFAQPTRSGEPDTAGGIFHGVEHVESSDRVGRNEGGKSAAAHANQAAGADQQIAAPGFADGVNLVVGQTVAGSVDAWSALG